MAASNRDDDKKQQADETARDGGREAGRAAEGAAGRAEDAGRSGARASAEAGRDGAARAGEAGREAGARAGEAGREGGRSLARGAREGGRGVREAMEEAGRGAEQASRRIGRQAENAVETTASQFDAMGDMLARAGREAAENARRMMMIPGMNGTGFRALQEASTTLLDRMMETNARIAHELVRRSNPGEVASMQQRLLRDYLEALADTSAELLSAARRFADEAMVPITEARWREEEQRRSQGGGGRKGEERGQAVRDAMSRNVRTVSKEDTVQAAARMMLEEDAGVLPVSEGDRLVGMVTDRDIAVRIAAEGKDAAKTKVRDVMTDEVLYCFEDEDTGHVADNMAEMQVQRLPVMDRDKRLVGIVSIGDIARTRSDRKAAEAMAGIAGSGSRHDQAAAAGR
jgi:CBS domain-containing protein